MKKSVNSCLCAFCAILLVGCATIPNGGYYGNVDKLGIPGPVLGEVQVGEGMLVQTIKIDKENEINIQINEDKDEYDQLLFDNILTIGKFSTLLGSGFTGKENIYYQKRISESGKDVFGVNDRQFLVTWECDLKDARTYLLSDHYKVTVCELFPLLKADPANE